IIRQSKLQIVWLLLDASMPDTYLRFVHISEDAAAGPPPVRGAWPTLSYETIGPTTNPSSTSTPSLLCLHGNSSHRGVWRPVVRELPEYRCVLLDFRGHGESEHISPAAYNPEHHAEDLAALVPRLMQTPYAILAHSAGALAAARFMTSRPAPSATAMPIAFVWVDLDPLVPRW